MNKEEIKELARESMLETLKTNLDSAMIFTYVKSLEDRINKAIELIEQDYFEDGSGEYIEQVLSILRGEDNE